MNRDVADLIDTHAHLVDDRLSHDIPGLLDRAVEAGVSQILCVGTTAADSQAVVNLASTYPQIHAAVGVHPNEAAEAVEADWLAVRQLAKEPKVLALGETGLDRHWDRTPFKLQCEWFHRHIQLSFETGLPLVIHCRESQEDLIRELRAVGRPLRGILHSFTGTWDHAQAFLDLGLFISFAGMVTFSNRTLDPLREVVARVPLDRLLVETDSPYLSPHPHRGRTNEPALVSVTARRIAEIREMSLVDLSHATSHNARRLLGFPSD